MNALHAPCRLVAINIHATCSTGLLFFIYSNLLNHGRAGWLAGKAETAIWQFLAVSATLFSAITPGRFCRKASFHRGAAC
ncbi:hypothetical protein [Rhodocyclus tenuis]|uniref:Uncharacterized protein n=1 Tax=Rhodocyclus tenuis TaxID=1066 RepID=A0A840G1X7_RHOTE|nr:hypothetical protein [Rhodocyclus tenuis]MBB4248294.1 hypothetical protein [Rhodocyclus tenuis]